MAADTALRRLAPYFNRHSHTSSAGEEVFALGTLLNRTSLAAAVTRDGRSVWEAEGRGRGARRLGRVLVLDDVLTPRALAAFRRVALESTMWHANKLGGYLCAFMDTGFASPLVGQMAAELQHFLPSVFCK